MRELAVSKIESAAIGLALGAVPVIASFVAGWWIAVPLLPESRVFLGALGGLGVGIAVDLIFLRGWIRRAYSIKPWVWMAVYAFYSLGPGRRQMGSRIVEREGVTR